MGAVTRLRPMRVLLAGADRRYLRVADALLERSGCATQTTEKPSDAPGVAVRWRPDLVVLDVTGGTGAALRAAATVQALEQSIWVLLVAEERDAARFGARAKWDALHDVVARIERGSSPVEDFEEASVEAG